MLANPYIDEEAGVIMSLGKDKAKKRGDKLGMERVQVYQLRTLARGQKPKNPVEMPKAPAVTAGSSPETREKVKKAIANTARKSKVKQSAMESRESAIDNLYPSEKGRREGKGTGALTTAEIRTLNKRYPSLEIKKKFPVVDYRPETATVGDKLKYIRPTYEHTQKGLDHKLLRVSSVKGTGANRRVFGVPIDENGNQIGTKQIPIVSTPTVTGGSKGNRYRRVVFD